MYLIELCYEMALQTASQNGFILPVQCHRSIPPAPEILNLQGMSDLPACLSSLWGLLLYKPAT